MYWPFQFQGWGDIVVTLITVFLVLRWFYIMILNVLGLAESTVLLPLTTIVLFSVGGMLLTFTTRQLWHLAANPLRIFLLPVFIFLVTWWQFIRFLALLTPQRIGTWGSRKGVDDKSGEVWFMSFEEYQKWR